MDLATFEAFLDPVILVNGELEIQYLNGAAGRWLALTDLNNVLGQHIDKYVGFSDFSIGSQIVGLKPWQYSQYLATRFRVPAHQYENFARVSIFCVPVDTGGDSFAIIVRDLVFAASLQDDGDLRFNRLTVMPAKPAFDDDITQVIEPAPSAAPLVADTAETKALDETTLINKHRSAAFVSRALLNFSSLNLNIKGQSALISEEWIEINIHGANPALDSKCSLELQGNSEISSFLATGSVVGSRREFGDFFTVRIRFDRLSLMTKKQILALVEKR